MSANKRVWTASPYAGFFWLGVVMTVACIAVVLAGNTEPLYRLERTSFPLSWAFAAVAILEFLAAEYCHHAESRSRGTNKANKGSVREMEAYEV